MCSLAFQIILRYVNLDQVRAVRARAVLPAVARREAASRRGRHASTLFSQQAFRDVERDSKSGVWGAQASGQGPVIRKWPCSWFWRPLFPNLGPGPMAWRSWRGSFGKVMGRGENVRGGFGTESAVSRTIPEQFRNTF